VLSSPDRFGYDRRQQPQPPVPLPKAPHRPVQGRGTTLGPAFTHTHTVVARVLTRHAGRPRVCTQLQPACKDRCPPRQHQDKRIRPRVLQAVHPCDECAGQPGSVTSPPLCAATPCTNAVHTPGALQTQTRVGMSTECASPRTFPSSRVVRKATWARSPSSKRYACPPLGIEIPVQRPNSRTRAHC
jgi:hypothetical protein